MIKRLLTPFIFVQLNSNYHCQINGQALVNAMDPASKPMVDLGRHLGTISRNIVQSPATITVRTNGGNICIYLK